MNATLSLIDLAGAIALLLWGLHMVQSGIQRAFGPHLRRFLTRTLGDRWRAFLAGLGVTAVLQSSTATGLMAASFAAGGLVDLVPALAITLGANLGTTLIVQVLSFDIGRVAPLFVLIGVILFRKSLQSRTRDLGRVAIGLGLMLLALQLLLALITPYEDVPSLRLLMGAIATQPVIDVILAAALTWAAHSSVATVLLLPLLEPFAWGLARLLPARAAPSDPSRPVYLDEATRETPALALAGAAREALRMADVTEAMLRGALDALDRGDRKQLAATKGLDNVLDRLNGAIKAYLTALDPDSLDEHDNRRLGEILAFITNLEHAGDIVEKGLIAIAAKRLKRGLAFSVEGQAEIRMMLERLAMNVQAAAAVFMTEDARAARQLLHEKEVFRDLEARATEAHFARIRAGRVESVETSALHLDVLRDMKRINAHLAAAAYPVLDNLGELLPSRHRR